MRDSRNRVSENITKIPSLKGIQWWNRPIKGGLLLGKIYSYAGQSSVFRGPV